MVRVNVGKNGSITKNKDKQPKLDDKLAKKIKESKKLKDKMKSKKLLKLKKQKLLADKKKHKHDSKKLSKRDLKRKKDELDSVDTSNSSDSDVDDLDDMTSDDDDDSFDVNDDSSNTDDGDDDTTTSDRDDDNPFGKDIDKQLKDKIKPIKSIDMPKKKVKLNMEIVSKDYVDICTQIHTLSKSLKSEKSDKKIIANLIYYYIKYFLYSCCIKKKPVFDWLDEFKDKIHIY